MTDFFHVDSGRDPWKIHRFRFGVGKNLQEWGGEGGGGGGKEKKNGGKKTEGEKRKGKKGGKKRKSWRQGESNRRRAYRLGNFYPSPTVTLQLHVNNSGLLLCTLMRMLSVTYNTHTHTSRII